MRSRSLKLSWVAIAAVAGLVAASASSGATGARHDERPYVGGPGDFTALCDPLNRGIGVGGGCFAILPGEERVLVWIDDASGASVGGFFRFVDASGATIRTSSFCARSNPVIPANAARILILVDEVFGTQNCRVNALTGQTGMGTTGVIHAFFLEDA